MNLRDRIAKAIYGNPPVWDQFPWDELTDLSRQVHLEQADAVIAVLGWNQIVDYCEEQAAVGWRDVGTADEAMGRNIVAETVLTILEGQPDE